MSVNQSLDQALGSQALILLVGQGYSDLVISYCVEYTQSFAHVDEVIAVIDIQDRLAE